MDATSNNAAHYTVDEDMEGFYWVLNSPFSSENWIQDGPFPTYQEAEENVISYIKKNNDNE